MFYGVKEIRVKDLIDVYFDYLIIRDFNNDNILWEGKVASLTLYSNNTKVNRLLNCTIRYVYAHNKGELIIEI